MKEENYMENSKHNSLNREVPLLAFPRIRAYPLVPFMVLAKMLPFGQLSWLAPAEGLSGACGPRYGVASRPHPIPLLYHPLPLRLPSF